MSSTPIPASSSGSRIIHVTIHRCTNLSNDSTVGCVEITRGYYVKATIGKVSQQTADRQVDEESQAIIWDEDFTFNNIMSSTMTLRVCRRRALRKSKVIEKLSVEIRDDTDMGPSALLRAVTFEAGPRLEFSLQVRKIDSAGNLVQRSEGLSVLDDNERVQVNFNWRTGIPFHNEAVNEPGIEDEAKAQEEVAKARQALESQGTPTAGFKRVLKGIESFSGVVDIIAEVHTFAQIACAIFRALTDPLIEQLDRDEQVRSLLEALGSFCETVNGFKDSDLGKNKNLRDVLKRAGIQLAEVAYFVQEYSKDGSFLKRAVKNKLAGMNETIGEYRSKLNELKEEFGLKLSIETAVVAARTEVKVVLILDRMEELVQTVNLDDLHYVLGAGLNTDKLCLAGTRIEFLDDIARWASFDGSRVLLLFGGAGTGKSSIAHSVAAQFREMGRLGSMFCFSRTEQATRKPSSLFPHIARDLADLHPNIRSKLCGVNTNKADRTASGITTQFEKLVLLPAEAIRARLHGPIVIVIDALDEAGTIEERRRLLDVLSSRLGELPSNFRVVITSRPERDIVQKFGKGSDIFIKNMEAIPSETTNQDIAKFVASQFADDPEVTVEIQQDLVSKAQDLFQWAFVASQFILSREPEVTALARYQAVAPPPPKKVAPSPDLPVAGGTEDESLNRLYRTVLSEALGVKGSVPIEHFKFVMARVLCAFAPLSCNSLTRFTATSESAPPGCDVGKVVAFLGSLLSGVEDHAAPIAPLHISFRDFLTDAEKSGEFFVNLDDPTIHSDMALASLSVMKKELRFNICQLPTSHLANKDIPGLEGLIEKHIPPYLVYACRYWMSHFCLAPTTYDWTQLTDEVMELVEVRALYWLEVLSLVGASESGVRELRRVYSWLRTAKKVKQNILDLVRDLESFWSYFAKCISRSATHIYVSALPFAPKGSLVVKNYVAPDDKTLSIPVGQLTKYPACLNILQGHTDSVGSVAFSPDGTRIASGSFDGTVRVWNAENGEMLLGPLNGHIDWIRSVAFSPDGTRIISGSSDATIRIWDAENGKMLLDPLIGHTSKVTSVAFSPDGSRIVSSSTDRTIRIWNSEDGQVVLGPLHGHTAAIFSVAFSPDGTRIVSGSNDRMIRVWNAENGQMVAGPLKGHNKFISSVAFSPNSARIISGSFDKTIRVWNAENGQLVLGPLNGHTDHIQSVAFSPDGSRIISGSFDKTIRIWDAENGQMLVGPLTGHTDPVYSVAFSSDGTRIISGSRDSTVRIWNPESFEMVSGPLNGHSRPINSIALSPNGIYVASGSKDTTIRIWNASNGQMVLGPLIGHTNAVFSVAFSPDGTRIASSSKDRTIRIWNATNGQMLLGPLTGHTEWVSSVAFSPDGSRIISGSYDSTIRVWDANDGQLVLGPLHGHTDKINSVSFSPDGSHVTSCSSDRAIRIWNAENGAKVLAPLHGHTDVVTSVTFSPSNSHIASGSFDKTIRIWNASNGQMVLGPLNGHTGAVLSVAFSPDGVCIVSGSNDGTIRIWSAKNGQMLLGPLKGHTSPVRSVSFSPDGSRIISGSYDSTIRVWNAQVPSIPDHEATTATTGLKPPPCPIDSKLHFNVRDRWTIKDDWFLDTNGGLLFYVPPVHRPGLYTPRTMLCIGAHPTHLDLTHFAHGSRWRESFSRGPVRDLTFSG